MTRANEKNETTATLFCLAYLACLVCLACFLCFAFASMGAYASGGRFPDMAGHWAEQYVNDLADRGVVSGMADGLFHPDSQVTTAQFTTMLIRSRYGDMPPAGGHWASGYLKSAYDQEVIIANDFDEPDTPLERRFAARIGHEALVKLFGEADEPDISVAEETLPDLYSCRTCVWHVAQLYIKGIMIGRPDGLFHNDDILTRAEAAIVIMKITDPSLRDPPASQSPKVKETGHITADEALRILESGKTALLIDVRSVEEHEARYIPGSICVPLDAILENLDTAALPSDKGTVIIVYCQKGSRSLSAYNALKAAGYSNVYNLGGIDDWPYATAGAP